jgi:GNAT superfamily N-acetyltransferase
MTDFRIRRAKEDDSRDLAIFMYESMLPGAGQGIFDRPLRDMAISPVDFHEALLRSRANNWGQIDSFFVIELDDGSLGGGVGAFLSSMPDLRPITAEGFARVSKHLGWTREMDREFWRNYILFFGPFGTAVQLSHPGDYVLEYAAVREDLRGCGLYAHLLAAHAQHARDAGFKSMSTTGINGNTAILRALTRFGFESAAHFGPEHYRGMFPGLTRLIYHLDKSNGSGCVNDDATVSTRRRL